MSLRIEMVKPEIGIHKWTWSTAEWDTLPESLTELEKEGWEIFSVIEIGELGRFVKIISRKSLDGTPS